jgi:hypothetical protein
MNVLTKKSAKQETNFLIHEPIPVPASFTSDCYTCLKAYMVEFKKIKKKKLAILAQMNVCVCTFPRREWSFKNYVRCVNTSRCLIACATFAGGMCRLYYFIPWIPFARCGKCHGTVIIIRSNETTGLQKLKSNQRKIRKWETEPHGTCWSNLQSKKSGFWIIQVLHKLCTQNSYTLLISTHN